MLQCTYLSRFLVCALLLLLTACTQSPAQTQKSATTSTAYSVTLTPLSQRTLHLPTLASGQACPVLPSRRVTSDFGYAIGDGPAYITVGSPETAQHPVWNYVGPETFAGGDSQGWGGQKVLWFVDPKYQGPILIRGRQLNGPHQVFFDSELQPAISEVVPAIPADHQWYNRPSYTRLQVPGCYAYQVDGTNFSEILVFEAAQISS